MKDAVEDCAPFASLLNSICLRISRLQDLLEDPHTTGISVLSMTSEEGTYYFFGYKTEFDPSKTIPKNLDPSYKMDLDLWECLRRVKLALSQNCIGPI